MVEKIPFIIEIKKKFLQINLTRNMRLLYEVLMDKRKKNIPYYCLGQFNIQHHKHHSVLPKLIYLFNRTPNKT